MNPIRKFLTLPEAIAFIDKRESNPIPGDRGSYFIDLQFGKYLVYRMD